MKPNGIVLNFGFDMPLCKSMASILNLAEKTMKVETGFHQMDENMIPYTFVAENMMQEVYARMPSL